MCPAMLSKSLIQFSVDVSSCVPSLLFTWGRTMVELLKMMVTSFRRSHAGTAIIRAHSVVYSYRSKLGLRCTWTNNSRPFCRYSSASPLTDSHTQNSVHSGEVGCLWKWEEMHGTSRNKELRANI